MFSRTITLFNYHESDRLWRATLFANVHVEEYAKNSERMRGNSIDEMADDSEIIQSKKDGYSDVILPCDRLMKSGNKQYVSPKEYQQLIDVSGCFTFTPEWDFIMTGDYYTDEALSDADYDVGLYHAMNDEHNNVYMISNVIWFGLLPHFEIEIKRPNVFPKLFRIYQYSTQTSSRGRERERTWVLLAEKRCLLMSAAQDDAKRFSQTGTSITHTIFHTGDPLAKENDVFSLMKGDTETRFFRVKAVQNHSAANMFTTYYCEEYDEMQVLTQDSSG